jgi:uridylate kinase
MRDRIGVMDATAVTLCRDNRLPIRVFALSNKGNIRRVIEGEPIGTLVSEVEDIRNEV